AQTPVGYGDGDDNTELADMRGTGGYTSVYLRRAFTVAPGEIPLEMTLRVYVDDVNMAYHHGNLKQALLERAAAVIAEKGLEGLSLRGLARDLGVSHAAPRRHFSDRDALIAALAQEGYRRVVATMKAGAEAAGADPVARYRALGRSYVRFAREDPVFFRALNDPQVRRIRDEALRDAEDEWFETLRAGAAEAQRAGWHPEATPEALVAFSFAGAMGAATLFSDASWTDRLGADDLEALADEVLDLIVDRTRTTMLEGPGEEDEAHRADVDDRRAS
ncbi:MAG: TetR/AcrR family transcriptional regulator, partial [Myxococcota bacterium]